MLQSCDMPHLRQITTESARVGWRRGNPGVSSCRAETGMHVRPSLEARPPHPTITAAEVCPGDHLSGYKITGSGGAARTGGSPSRTRSSEDTPTIEGTSDVPDNNVTRRAKSG